MGAFNHGNALQLFKKAESLGKKKANKRKNILIFKGSDLRDLCQLQKLAPDCSDLLFSTSNATFN